jgi:predicted transposase YbfD/YdcC
LCHRGTLCHLCCKAMTTPLSLAHHFDVIPDPRLHRTRRHKLVDILVIAICATLCGAENFVEIELYARAKEAWLRERLELAGGIPSHDTFNRVFARLDPKQFHDCFVSWVEVLQACLREKQQSGEMAEPVIALDGKTLRHSFDRAKQLRPLHIVSAWTTINSPTLGQMKVESKSNEITAIPALLELLDLMGCIVTIDSMGTQKEIARQIIEKGGIMCFR